MARRRGILKVVGATVAGAAGFGVWSGELSVPESASAVDDIAGSIGEPPATETQVGVVDDRRPSRSPLDKLVFFESGAVEVWFPEDHALEHIGVTHNALDLEADTFDRWEAPRFRGPKVIDLAAVIKSNGPYPSNQFKIGSVSTEGTFVLSPPLRFAVPDSFLPE